MRMVRIFINKKTNIMNNIITLDIKNFITKLFQTKSLKTDIISYKVI